MGLRVPPLVSLQYLLTALLLGDVVHTMTSFYALEFHAYHYAPAAGEGGGVAGGAAHEGAHHYVSGLHGRLGPGGVVQGVQCDGRPVVVHSVHALGTVLPCSAVAALAACALVAAAAVSERARATRLAALGAPLLQPLVVGFPRAFSTCGTWCEGRTELSHALPYFYLGGVFFLGGVIFLTVVALVVCPCCYRSKGPSTLAVTLKNGAFSAAWVYMHALALAGYVLGEPCQHAAVAYAYAPVYVALVALGGWRLLRGVGPCLSGDSYCYHRAVSHAYRVPCAEGADEEGPQVEDYDPTAETYLELVMPGDATGDSML